MLRSNFGEAAICLFYVELKGRKSSSQSRVLCSRLQFTLCDFGIVNSVECSRGRERLSASSCTVLLFGKAESWRRSWATHGQAALWYARYFTPLWDSDPDCSEPMQPESSDVLMTEETATALGDKQKRNEVHQRVSRWRLRCSQHVSFSFSSRMQSRWVLVIRRGEKLAELTLRRITTESKLDFATGPLFCLREAHFAWRVALEVLCSNFVAGAALWVVARWISWPVQQFGARCTSGSRADFVAAAAVWSAVMKFRGRRSTL